MLANIGGRNNHLRLADIVVLDKDNLQQISDVRVAVDFIPDGSGETNDCLSL